MDEVVELSIGEFALATGLSVTRLRRYHELGLLVPGRIDPQTGYRSYGTAQIDDGRRINRMRKTDLPLEDLAHIMTNGGHAMSVLRRHRHRLVDRLSSMNQMVELTDKLITEGNCSGLVARRVGIHHGARAVG